ncbi:MAG: replication-associated recombination protein A, partial [Oscillospiraceae bacterium]|nr:replication-associated recombination protein A [Oscillospiraceae bacterium]
CTAPKSNSAAEAIFAAMEDVKNGATGEVPAHLRDSHYGGAEKLGHGAAYRYPHDYPGHYVKQQYLPDRLKERVYYRFGENRTEQAAKAYRRSLTGEEQEE